MNKETKEVVYKILEQDEYARENDNYLIFRTLNEMTGIDKKTAIWSVLSSMKYKGISFESITRHRRKFFEIHPELKNKVTEIARRTEEKEYYNEFSKFENHIPRID